jgi:ATP/maltotriose-dependent transcriptional regulator MalT
VVRDELLEIDAAALRFDLAETAELLDASSLDETRLRELLASTEEEARGLAADAAVPAS